MNKHLKSILAVLTCSLLISGCGSNGTAPKENASQAETQKEETQETGAEFVYEKKGDSLVLTEYKGDEEILYIPDQIDGLPVTEIGESCFAGDIHLKKVHVPEGVTAVQDFAFECCSMLEKVYLPESLVKLGRGAFSGCGELCMVDLQDQVEEIGDGAFLYCRNIVSFVAPSSLKQIGEYVFAGCEGMYKADLSKSQITEIPGRTFYRNNVLTRVSLPDTLEKIGKRAFSLCPAVKYLYLPEAVNEIASYAFENCDELTSIDIRGGEVASYAFSGCYGMYSVNFPDNAATIRKDAFINTNLSEEEQYIPEAVTVEKGAFPVYEEADEEGDPFVSQEEEGEEKPFSPPKGAEIKTVDEIIDAAKAEGYRVITNDEFFSWADEYTEFNKDTAILTIDGNVYTTMYKGQIEGYYAAMTAAATKAPSDIENAYRQHGDDFIPMFEMVNHGLRTEMERFKMKDDLLLVTGVYDSQLMAASGGEEVPTMEELKELKGKTFTDPCLTSTTNDVNVAVHFSDTMFIIYAPAESVNALGAVCMDGYMKTPEKETLLFSGAEYEILDAGYFSFEQEDEDTGKEETRFEKYVLLQLIN